MKIRNGLIELNNTLVQFNTFAYGRFVLLILLCGSLLPLDLVGQNKTMTFDNGASEPGFTFTHWLDKDEFGAITGEIYAQELTVNDVETIAKNELCFDAISFDIKAYWANLGPGGGKWRVWSDKGDEKFFFITSTTYYTIPLNWTGIKWFKMQLVDIPVGSNPVNTFSFDNFVYNVPVVTSASMPTVTATTACQGSPTTLTITGSLNDATAWKIYSGSCGGTLVGSTTGTSFNVTPTTDNTIYYVRGEGPCVFNGDCGSVTVPFYTLPTPSVTVTDATNGGANGCINITNLPNGASSSLNSGTPTLGKIQYCSLSSGIYTVKFSLSTCAQTSATTIVNNIICSVNVISAPSVTNPVCSGNSVTLTAKATGTGTMTVKWQRKGASDANYSDIANTSVSYTSGTDATYMFTPTANDDGASYRAVFTSSCSAEAATNAATLTVKTTSIAPTSISGTTNICYGQSTTLSVVGGTLGTGAIEKWTTGSCGGTVAGSGNSITVSPTETTTYFVRYAGDCNVTDCVSVTVTVKQPSDAPTSISGTTTICNGQSTTLSVVGGTLGTGAIEKWTTGSCGGTVAGSGNSITVSPTETTTYFVRYAGDCNVTDCVSKTVTVNQKPIGGTLSPASKGLCGSSTVSLSLSGQSGTINQWESSVGCSGTWTPIASSAGKASLSVTPTATTCYRVKMSNGVCDAVYSATSTISVDLPAVGGIVVLDKTSQTSVELCAGQSAIIKLIDYTGTVTKWQNRTGNSAWTDMPNTAGKTTLAVFGYASTSAYSYKAFVASSLGICTGKSSSAVSSEFRVTKKTTCTSTNLAMPVVLYPNPAKNVLTVQLDNITEGSVQFDIMDVSGRVVKTEKRDLLDGYNEVTLDINSLATGLHFIKIKDSGNHEAVVKMSKM